MKKKILVSVNMIFSAYKVALGFIEFFFSVCVCVCVCVLY